MTTIAWPDGLEPAQFELALRRATVQFRSPVNGAFDAVDLLAEQWEAQVTFAPQFLRASGALEAFINRLVGGATFVSMHPLHRPEPRGTLRGSPTLASGVAQFASSFTFSGASPGKTLEPGDFFGLDGQWFQVSAQATASGGGSMTVSTINRARRSIAGGSAVTLVRPTATFAMVDATSKLVYTADGLASPGMTLVEVV